MGDNLYHKLRKKVAAFYWRERKVSYGKENADKTFYVIRRHASRAGLFSFYSTNLGSILEAVSKGYIPVIDMQNSINPMLEQQLVGKENAWDYYFKQPFGYNLNDISHSANVVLGSIDPPQNFPDYGMIKGMTDSGTLCEELIMWREAAHKYMHIIPEIEKKVNDNYDVISKGERMIGVLCRGTDYVKLKPHNHPIQPNTDDVIIRCEQEMAKFECSRIYLATEDKTIWDKFTSHFGDKVCSYQKHHFVTTEGQNVNDIANQAMNPKDRNMEYLISIDIISKCNCFIGGANGGTYGALLMSSGFEHEYVYDLGLYE